MTDPPPSVFGTGAPSSGDPDFDRVWSEFERLFPTEEAAVEEICRRLNETEYGLRCSHCGSCQVSRNYGKRVYRCLQCKRRRSFTAGTFFDRMKRLRACVAAIWLMEQGTVFNASTLPRRLTLAYSSSLSIFKKLALVIERQMGEACLSVPSRAFLPVVCKRSRETPVRRHPSAEEEELGEESDGQRKQGGADDSETGLGTGTVLGSGQPPFAGFGNDWHAAPATRFFDEISSGTDGSTRDGATSDPTSGLSGLERQVYEHISDQPAQFDSLCLRTGLSASELSVALLTLELERMVQRQPGDQYVRTLVRAEHKQSRQPSGAAQGEYSKLVAPAAMKSARPIIKFIRSVFHGISRKYLQNYLSVHWGYMEKARWQSGGLIKRCLRSPPIIYAEMLAYVSPPRVRMFSPAA